MHRKTALPVPEPILQLQHQLDQFRSAHPPRTKLPESLWQAAVDHPLRLDYMGLKKRLGGVPSAQQKAHKLEFVELVAPQPAPLPECVVEFESSAGEKMRIQWKASAPPDWAGLLRAWRDAER